MVLIPSMVYADTTSNQKLLGYVTQSQKLNGAIVETPSSNFVEPVFSTTAAQWALDHGGIIITKSYMDWFFNHINSKGYVYEYYENSTFIETPTNKVDAIDSDITSFLSLLRDYYDKTGDKSYMLKYQTQINKMVSILNTEIQPNGLLQEGGISDLEDNIQDFKSYYDYGFLLFELGDTNYSKYIQTAYNIERGIENNLYKNGTYIQCIGCPPFNWNRMYPDAQQNVIVLEYDLPESKSRTTSLWNNFTLHQGSWKQVNGLFPYTELAIGSICAKDQVTMNTYLNNFNNNFGNNLQWGFFTGDVVGISSMLDYQNGVLPSCLKNTSVTGIVYNDSNGNGKQDPNELGVPNVKINVYSYVTGKPLPSMVTDSTGHYTLSFIPSGGLAVLETIPYGKTNTQPGTIPNTNISGAYYVTVNSTKQAVYNFGNK